MNRNHCTQEKTKNHVQSVREKLKVKGYSGTSIE